MFVLILVICLVLFVLLHQGYFGVRILLNLELDFSQSRRDGPYLSEHNRIKITICLLRLVHHGYLRVIHRVVIHLKRCFLEIQGERHHALLIEIADVLLPFLQDGSEN